jgi:hypothetical protein
VTTAFRMHLNDKFLIIYYPFMKLLLAFTALSLVTSCKRHADADTSPNAANTFTCQIEGKAFTPYLAPVLLVPVKALAASRTSHTLGFSIAARDSYNELELYVASSQGVGTYPLGYARNPIPYRSNPNSYAAYTSNPALPPGGDPNNLPPPSHYYTDGVNTGSVTISRFDTVARVITGKFNYIAREAATGKLVHITNGSFDVPY